MLPVSLDCLRPVFSVPNVASVSGLSIADLALNNNQSLQNICFIPPENGEQRMVGIVLSSLIMSQD
jgi:hypothetical protein